MPCFSQLFFFGFLISLPISIQKSFVDFDDQMVSDDALLNYHDD